ncbi:MAG: ester cyclase [Candidatus Omnitrophica bacterium]|nr:ester cyclase [Candidatus Omnitrophota bacterium]
MLKKIVVVGLIMALCGTVLAQEKKEDKKQWVRHFYSEVLNKGGFNLIDSLVAENYYEHEPLPGYPPDRDGLKQFFIMMRNAFPDLNNDIEFMIVEGDKVVSYVTMTGTHKGEYMGIAGTGKSFKIKVIDIIRVVNGKMTEHWGAGDYMTMMEQLGINSH